MKNYNISLTEQEYKIIIEALLYSSNTFMDSNWYQEDIKEMTDLVIKFRKENPSVLTSNVFCIDENQELFEFCKENPETIKNRKKIIDFFPEIVENVCL